MIKAYSIAALLLVLVPSSRARAARRRRRTGRGSRRRRAGPGRSRRRSLRRLYGRAFDIAVVGTGRLAVVAAPQAGFAGQRARRPGGSRRAPHPVPPVRPNGAAASPAIPCRTRRAPPASCRPSRPSTERIRPPDAALATFLQRRRPPTGGGRTTVTVQAASAATLAETLPSSVRSIEFCRAPTRR